MTKEQKRAQNAAYYAANRETILRACQQRLKARYDLERGRARAAARGDLDLREPKGVAQLFTTLIIAWVLAESIAIYGLVLRVVGAGIDLWSSYSVVGGLLLLVGRPWQRGLQVPPGSRPRTPSNDPIS